MNLRWIIALICALGVATPLSAQQTTVIGVPNVTSVVGVLPVANGGTNASSASITAFNNITGYTAAGATGTTSTNVVFSTSPSLTTPVLGAATGTSLALGGCTIGSDGLCITGTGTISAALSVGALAVTGNTCPANGFYLAGANNPAVCVNSTQTASWSTTSASALAITFSGDANYFVRNSSTNSAARAIFNLGNGFSATDVQMILNANANVSGNGARSFTINAGNGMFLQGNGTNALTISAAQLVALPAITTDATHTDATVCEDTTSHALYFGSGTAGICLGTSSARYKRDIVDMPDGLAQIVALAPKNYFYREGYGDSGAREQYGLVAEDVIHVLPKLVHLDEEGKPNSVDLLGMVPILIKAVQELKADNDDLRARLQTVRASR